MANFKAKISPNVPVVCDAAGGGVSQAWNETDYMIQ